ncbi:hypothetical protein ACU4GR_13265 [Methylobacterium oryzae CBMB20]
MTVEAPLLSYYPRSSASAPHSQTVRSTRRSWVDHYLQAKPSLWRRLRAFCRIMEWSGRHC